MSRAPDVFLAEIMKMDKNIRLFDGVENLVKTLHKKFKLAIVSNGDKRRIKHQLDANDMAKYFDAIIVAVTYGYQPGEMLMEADILVNTPGELLSALEAL